MIKLFVYNKYNTSLEDFIAKISDYVAAAPKILSLELIEDLNNSDIIWKFVVDSKVPAKQSIYITSWKSLLELESLLNGAVENERDPLAKVQHIRILKLAKSPRALGALIIERPNEAPKESPTESDTKAHAIPNKRTKRGSVRRHRAPAE